MNKKLITVAAIAGGFVAGSIHGLAQTSGQDSAATATTPTRPADSGTATGGGTAPANPPAGPSQPNDPAQFRPITGTVPGVIHDGVVVPLPGGSGDPAATRPIPPATTPPDQSRPPSVVLVAVPGATRPGEPTRTVGTAVMPQATGSGAVVLSGDIVQLAPGERATGAPPASPVISVVQQFEAQRSQELAARATALEQLRTATPEQRAAIIADMQAAAQRQSVEQREGAREIRNELRALREQRKGK